MWQRITVALFAAFLVDAQWVHVEGMSKTKSVLELIYDDGSKDMLVFENKDINTPKMMEKVDKVLKERENEP